MRKTDPSKAENSFPIERRSGKDRRTKRFGDILWLLKTGQRRQVRRESDRRKILMLDRYPSELRFIIMLVLGLSVIDAFLTLWLIDRGAIEINPVMAYYLQMGPDVFMATKYLITAAVVTIAVMLNYAFIRFSKFQFGQLLKVFAGCFGLVVAWQLYMIASLVI